MSTKKICLLLLLMFTFSAFGCKTGENKSAKADEETKVVTEDNNIYYFVELYLDDELYSKGKYLENTQVILPSMNDVEGFNGWVEQKSHAKFTAIASINRDFVFEASIIKEKEVKKTPIKEGESLIYPYTYFNQIIENDLYFKFYPVKENDEVDFHFLNELDNMDYDSEVKVYFGKVYPSYQENTTIGIDHVKIRNGFVVDENYHGKFTQSGSTKIIINYCYQNGDHFMIDTALSYDVYVHSLYYDYPMGITPSTSKAKEDFKIVKAALYSIYYFYCFSDGEKIDANYAYVENGEIKRSYSISGEEIVKNEFSIAYNGSHKNVTINNDGVISCSGEVNNVVVRIKSYVINKYTNEEKIVITYVGTNVPLNYLNISD